MSASLAQRRTASNGAEFEDIHSMSAKGQFDFKGHPPGHRTKRQSAAQLILLALVLGLGAYVGSLAFQGLRLGPGERGSGSAGPGGRRVLRDGTVETDTLVIYIFSNTDPEYIEVGSGPGQGRAWRRAVG